MCDYGSGLTRRRNHPARRAIFLSFFLLGALSPDARAQSSVVFSGFDNPDSEFRVRALCKTARPDLTDTNGVNNWEQWCFNITSLNNTSKEFNHFGVLIDPSQHLNNSGVQSTIQSSMTVSPNDGDYDKQFRTSGGPLSSVLPGAYVLWNNNYDHITNAGESASFCYATPTTGLTTATVGLKVGGDRRSAALDVGNNPLAIFSVTKAWDDGNPDPVEVHLRCNDGIEPEQSYVLEPGESVNFILHSFREGWPTCRVYETPVDGYSADYNATNGTDTPEGCTFENIGCGFQGLCEISNSPDPVKVAIEKKWEFANSSETDVDTTFSMWLYCDSPIVDGQICLFSHVQDQPHLSIAPFCRELTGEGDTTVEAEVIPDYPASSCFVEEVVKQSFIEVDNGCTDLSVAAGSDVSCIVTNTVFFEGIPALGRNGMVLLTLLTLGLGAIALRRMA